MKNQFMIIIAIALFCLSVWIITFLAIKYPSPLPNTKQEIIVESNFKVFLVKNR